MKQFMNVFNFEIANYLKNKVFIGMTVFLIVAVGVLLSFPRISGMLNIGGGTDDKSDKSIILIADTTGFGTEASLALFKEALTDNILEATDKSKDELFDIIAEPESNYLSAIVIESATKYTYIAKNVGLYDVTNTIVDEVMLSRYRVSKMQELGVAPEQINEFMSANIESEIVNTGKDQLQTFFYTYILIFLLYMAILLYGQFVATAVATEKSSRAMELLITSANTNNLMFGKVIGAGAAGLFQIAAVLGSSFIFFNLNKKFWIDNPIINSIFNMPIDILLYTVLFFVLGFFIYAFLYGAIGSLASKVEDLNTSLMPITFLFIAAFFIVMFSMGSGNIDNPLMLIASYVPFTSPMAMFVRVSMSEVSAIEVIISVAILLLSTLGIGFLSAKIYKVGVLLYGKPPKLGSVIKAIISERS